jgi:hypothetical protein
MSAAVPIERRSIAGTRLTTSVLGLVVDPTVSTRPAENRPTVALLRKARASGVTTFDLAGSSSPSWAAEVLLTAFPHWDPEVVVVLGAPAQPTSGPGQRPSQLGPPSRPRPPEASQIGETAELARRLSQIGSILVEWDPGQKPSLAARETRQSLDDLTQHGAIAGSCIRCRPDSELPAKEESPLRPPVSAELSLLDVRLLKTLASRFHDSRGAVLVRDPFAQGRLDGSRFSARLSDRGPSSTPRDVRTLHAEFDPVLRLAPLTRDRRRTLAQASVQFLVRWPWVASVLLPLPAPERWEEIRTAPNALPLDEGELRELGLLPRTNASSASARGP